MGFNWKEAAEGDNYADKLTPGYHKVKITRVMRETKGGKVFISKDGDPQLLAVVENGEGQQATTMFTLTDKAGWTLARFLEAAGADLERMEREGVEPSQFEDVSFARKQLEGRELWISAEEKTRNGKTYLNIFGVKTEDLPPNELKKASHPQTAAASVGAEDDSDSIPF